MQSICSSKVERFAESEIHTTLGTSEATPQDLQEKKQRQANDVSMPLSYLQPVFTTPFYVQASGDILNDTERMARQGIRAYRNLGWYIYPLWGKGNVAAARWCSILHSGQAGMWQDSTATQ